MLLWKRSNKWPSNVFFGLKTSAEIITMYMQGDNLSRMYFLILQNRYSKRNHYLLLYFAL